jgi:DNA helicase-2/ATP-dependent DNA helicase PcrA
MLPLDEFVDLVFEKTSYVKVLEEQNTWKAGTRLENLLELNQTSFPTSFERIAFLGAFWKKRPLVSDIDRYGEPRRGCPDDHSQRKGLEFPVVFVAGAEEGLFPGMMVSATEELEEERRLCYVALTRAKQELFVTTAKERLLYGKTVRNRPSRFIGEIYPDCREEVSLIREIPLFPEQKPPPRAFGANSALLPQSRRPIRRFSKKGTGCFTGFSARASSGKRR